MLKIQNTKSPWLKNIKHLHLPVAHQEGKFLVGNDVKKKLLKNKLIAGHRGEAILKAIEHISPNKLPQEVINQLVHGANEEDIIASGLEDTMRVAFQEILENPADLEINLKYATEQEGLGRYKATLSTLERLNMLYPVNTDIKLYLISILFWQFYLPFFLL